MQSTTKTSQRIKDRIAKYRANPIRGDVRLADAVRLIQGKAEDDMARKARKAPTAAQLKARAAFTARYGKKRGGAAASTTADNPRKKRRKRRSNPAAAAPTASNPKRRRKRRRANPAAARPVAAANPKRRRKRRRANPAAARPAAANPTRRRRRRRANPRVATYTRKKTVRGHYRKPAKKTRRRSKHRDNPVAGRGITVHTHMHGGAPVVQDNPKRRRRRRRSNPASMPYIPAGGFDRGGMLDNPSYSGLFENPMGAFSSDSLKAFGVASAGLALGLLVARGVDRFVATMKPAKSKSGTEAQRAWYGKNAVAAVYRRPNALRLGVQAGGAVAAIGGAYMLRNKSVAPWLLGGIALGFGSNLLLQLAEWYIIPRIFKIEKDNDQTLANRLYVLEQIDTQDKVDEIMEDWSKKPALMANQEQADTAVIIQGPLNDASSPDIATLGRGAAGSRPSGATLSGQARRFVADGRVGNCGECGGQGGHYSGCAQCQVCNGGGGGRRCAYTVQAGADIYAIASAAGVDIADIAAMNGGGSPESWWIVGQRVTLPEAACNVVINQGVPVPQEPPVAEEPPPGMMVAGNPETPSTSIKPQNTNVAFALAGGQDD
ncbi:MAG: hypothetical protein AMXMBFR56_62340 [Polyangiaceae bacterium]